MGSDSTVVRSMPEFLRSPATTATPSQNGIADEGGGDGIGRGRRSLGHRGWPIWFCRKSPDKMGRASCVESWQWVKSLSQRYGEVELTSFFLQTPINVDSVLAELAVGNIVRRVLHIIKEEDISSTAVGIEGLSVTVDSDDEFDSEHDDRPALSAAVLAAHARNALRAPSLQTLLEDIPVTPAISRTASSTGDSDGKSKSGDKSSTRKLKHDVIAAIGDLIDEIDSCYEPISEQAVELIHQNEVILTLGRSRTVKEFLYAAKEKKRSFRVFVAEGAPRYQGHVLAKELVEKGVQTTVIIDSAVFAMISRVNMVIVGAHAIMANGGVIAPVGMNMVALAAQRHAVPFVVVAGSHKLCPLYPHNPEVLLNELKSPSDLLDFGEFSDCMNFSTQDGSPLLNVVNPTFDYVPPKLVSLFVTDTGGHSPSYMYRLIAEYYSADDLVVQRKSTA
ncbi:translation initiation factor eIF-2B subunit beta [Setaria italica]|nr:translation initiation factor eIF-2B subunit beta [Setaria italica]